MPFIALLQAAGGGPQSNMIIIAVAILFALVLLGLKFGRILFEVVTAPGASVGYHGKTEGYFYGLMVVLLGSLIATLIMLNKAEDIRHAYDGYSTMYAKMLSDGASNKIYADVVNDNAHSTLNNNFENYVMGNLIAFPLLVWIYWMVISFFAFLFSKMFQGAATLPQMCGATAYGFLFGSIGFGLSSISIAAAMSNIAQGQQPAPDVMGIIGCVLFLYGLILVVMGIGQAADITGGQVIFVLIMLGIILGGASYYGVYKSTEAFQAWSGTVRSYDPSK